MQQKKALGREGLLIMKQQEVTKIPISVVLPSDPSRVHCWLGKFDVALAGLLSPFSLLNVCFCRHGMILQCYGKFYWFASVYWEKAGSSSMVVQCTWKALALLLLILMAARHGPGLCRALSSWGSVCHCLGQLAIRSW